MILTNEILESNGFTTNHPENILRKYYLHGEDNGKEYRIVLENSYLPITNEVGFNVKIENRISGTLNKEAMVTNIKTVEDLKSIIELCDLNINID